MGENRAMLPALKAEQIPSRKTGQALRWKDSFVEFSTSLRQLHAVQSFCHPEERRICLAINDLVSVYFAFVGVPVVE